MPELPDYMPHRGRAVIPFEDPEERLFRRVPHELWDEEIELDAIDFPDMSVCRESCGEIDSVRWIRKEGNDEYLDWGVIAFRVKDATRDIPFDGYIIYRLKPEHVPLKHNYPHSEIRVYEVKWEDRESETRVDKKTISLIPRGAQLKWREWIRTHSKIVLRPGQPVPEKNKRANP